MHITYPIASAAYSHFPVLVLDEGMRSIVNRRKRNVIGLPLPLPSSGHRWNFRDSVQGTLSSCLTDEQWCCRQTRLAADKQRPRRIVQCFGDLVKGGIFLRRLQTQSHGYYSVRPIEAIAEVLAHIGLSTASTPLGLPVRRPSFVVLVQGRSLKIPKPFSLPVGSAGKY